MDERDAARLTRPIHEMPDDIRKALQDRGLAEAYEARPPYQRNDYLAWITRAKGQATRNRRLSQMLDELSAGEGYMNMAWRRSR
jgi:uncharacterized protein YdeI (YjbR/CyaY-like superfamily)